MIPIEVYRKEIFDFLKTVSIKFKPFADIHKNLKNNCDEDVYSSDLNNPYYRNLNGEYTQNDVPINITTIEDGTTVLLSKANLLKYPKTASIYRVPNIEFDILCERYPLQKGLIKSIIYPASDIKTVVESPNLTLLAYDDSLLHINEKESIIECLKNFLNYTNDKWFVKEFVFEELYPAALWSIIWMHLPQVLLTQRISNIKTSSVHPFHIWEYLESKGLKNYSSILTNMQSLWLYRNIDYIYKNQGKASNLLYLSDNLLSDVFVSLVGKTIYQQTIDKFDDCITVPEYISEEVVSYKLLSDKTQSKLSQFESVSYMNSRLFYSKLETTDNIDYTDQLQEDYALTQQNITPTKLVEIQKNPIDNRYESLLMEFLLDTFIYKLSSGELIYNLKFNDPLTGALLDLHPTDILCLLHWSILRSTHQDPVYIPNKYVSRIAYKDPKIDFKKLPKYIYYLNTEYQLDAVVNTKKVVEEIPSDIGICYTRDDFIELTTNQFRVMQYHVRQVRRSAELLYMQGMCEIYDHLTVHEELKVNFSEHMTFSLFFDNNEKLNDLKNAYEELPNACTFYDQLATKLLLLILPIEDNRFREFVGISDDMTELYTGLKNLLIQLSSYNITFLDTSRLNTQHIFTTPIAYNPMGVERESKLDFITWFNFKLFGEHIVNLQYNLNNNVTDNGHILTNELELKTTKSITNTKIEYESLGKYIYGSKVDIPLTEYEGSTINYPLLKFNIT